MLGCLCRTCLGHNCLVEKKLQFKRGEGVLEKVEKFCYLCDMISCYGGASQAVSARTGSVSKKSRKLSGVLVGRQGLSLKQQEKIYQCCVRPVLLYCCEIWELAVVDEVRLHGCCCEDRGCDNSKLSAVVWSCHAWRHQFPNM